MSESIEWKVSVNGDWFATFPSFDVAIECIKLAQEEGVINIIYALEIERETVND
jgi:hypothetical protein